uniref:ARF7 effector protein C-terminal domain-containing protein n=1 Tax=Trichobilharzia regenti TaxID=157069 RepID=A0AA85JGT8_TRIRE|nr:unnamed protein product [Trichobilharzia regenti]
MARKSVSHSTSNRQRSLPKRRVQRTARRKRHSANRVSENRELDRLKFVNPGRRMKSLKVNWSEPNLTRSIRKQLNTRSKRKAPNRMRYLYDSRGRLLQTLEDICDCMRPKCSGCHLSCRKCRSMCCGATCRIYRTFRVNEVKVFI